MGCTVACWLAYDAMKRQMGAIARKNNRNPFHTSNRVGGCC
jgi:hypothetical protein